MAKAVVQKAISLLPNATAVNSWFQNNVTKRTAVTDKMLAVKVDAAAGHLEAARQHGVGDGFSVIDLGAGWHPIGAVYMYLAGADRVQLVDIEDHFQADILRETLAAMVTWAEEGRLASDYGLDVDMDRVAALRRAAEQLNDGDPHQALAPLGITSVIGDARNLDIDPVDLVVSTHTLEHIPYDVTVGILTELHRLTAPGGVMTHLVDMCDHHAYVDPSVSVFNFLRFSERAWRLIDNTLQPMNRLRVSQYRQAYRDAGVPISDEWTDSADLDEVAAIPLASPFAEMDPEIVAVKTARFTTLVDAA